MPHSVIVGLLALALTVIGTWPCVRPADFDARVSNRSYEWRTPASDEALFASPNPYPLGLRVVDGSLFIWKLTFASLGSACVQVVVGDRILASRIVESATGELNLPIDRAQLEGAREPFVLRVRSSGDGGPIENVRVSARTTSGYTVTHSTDEHGRARFDDLFALEFELEAAVSGHVLARRRAQRPLDAEIELTLQPGRDLRGTRVDESGHPEPEGTIGLFRWPAQGPSEVHISRVTSDADGRFVFTDVPRESLVLIGTDDDSPPVLSKGTEPWKCPVEAGGDVEGLVIRLLHVESSFPPTPLR